MGMLYIGANMVESLLNSDLDSFKLYILTLNTETLVSKSKYWIYFFLIMVSRNTGISFSKH